MPASTVARPAAVSLLLLLAAARGGGAQDAARPRLEPLPEPGPAVVDDPPMYLPDPHGDGFSAMPPGVAVGLAPDWPRWFAGASGLVMTRTLPAGAATMQPLGGATLTTGDAGATWPGGVDLHLGRWFGMQQRHGVEFVYWGVYGLGGTGLATSAARAIEAIPQAPGVTVGGRPATSLLTGLAAERIVRSDVVNDVEINWLYSLWDRPEFLPRDRVVNLMWLAGFRYFGLGDRLTLQTVAGGPPPGGLDVDVATSNAIFGAQVGAKFDWRFLPRLRLDVVPKFMVGGNSITNTSVLAGADGVPGTFTSDSGPASVHSTLGVFSWLGSVDTAVAWDVTNRWSLWLGYRVVGVGGIAEADGQWPSVVTSPASLSGIVAGSSTIVHGGFAGFEGRY